VISKARPAFWRAYDRLASPVKIRAREVYRVFEKNPNHPLLCFKKLRGRDDVWSVRINEQYRAVGVRSGNTIEWIWIGTHNEFDNLFS
jgi:Txe/YoeB family toxin of Txe-Axe toxin-antitoxin module